MMRVRIKELVNLIQDAFHISGNKKLSAGSEAIKTKMMT